MRTMLFPILILMHIASCFCQDSYINNPEDRGELIWADEFENDALDENQWNIIVGDGCPNLCGWGNRELQYYLGNNISFANGLMIITAKQEKFKGRDYTSARINTDGKVFMQYGRIDVRAKLPEGKGIWPAIWMMGSTRSSLGWPACGEIDIMELKGSAPYKTCGTLHYKNLKGSHQNSGAECHTLDSAKFSEDFHIFSLIRNESQISWLIDNRVFHQVNFSELNTTDEENPFKKEFFLLINLAVGGNYDGNPDVTTLFPQTMEIDYVRIYQEKE